MQKLMDMVVRVAGNDTLDEETKEHVISILKLEWKAQKQAFINRRGW